MKDQLPIASFFERPQKLQACIHCGLCLQACPTYLETGEEMSSPRGRIYLMKALDEGRISPSDTTLITHENSCLVCRACETACPSGVEFGVLMEQTREILNHASKPNRLRTFIYTRLLGARGLTRFMQYSLALITRARIPSLLLKTFQPHRSGLRTLAASVELLPSDVPFPEQRSAIYPTMHAKRGSVGLLIGCIGDLFTSQINDATISVLNCLGYDVHTIPEIACCGALATHAGFGERARDLAIKAIEVLERSSVQYFISNIAGCGAMLKNYPSLFEGTSDHARAIRLSEKVRDISEFLLEFHTEDIRNMNLRLSERTSIGYQAPCHLYHGQQLKETPVELLKLIENADPFPLAENEICCGSAGTYNIEHAEMGVRLLERKMAVIKSSRPQIMATANAGCLMQLQKGFRERGDGTRVLHVIEILSSLISKNIL